jgi:transposase InsO family protein
MTDDGKKLTDRRFALRARVTSARNESDQLCTELGIEHGLNSPRLAQTNGMVARFNGRIDDVLKTSRFDSAHNLAQITMRYVARYNIQWPKSVLGSRTPM